MTQPIAENDGLTANQRRDRDWLDDFQRLKAYIADTPGLGLGNRRRLAEADLLAMARRAPHLFGIDQHGQPFVRETSQ